ncbi:hypothetical protein XELAEV_18037454mg [Xenopus laevis]|uniref:Uncharacterized protein n=1 Tax=Xenopus laevis TaxID=8355 RepID=A0A974HA73_XENLA|nr:hypothetical protein XELAEV_18037454mg [Xenopus laevis]
MSTLKKKTNTIQVQNPFGCDDEGKVPDEGEGAMWEKNPANPEISNSCCHFTHHTILLRSLLQHTKRIKGAECLKKIESLI